MGNKIKTLFKNPVFITIANILVLIIAYSINYIENQINGINLIYGAICVTLIVILSIIIYSLYTNQELEDKIAILRGFLENNGVGDIINEQTLASWESLAQYIWVVSLDLSNDIGSDNLKKTDKIIMNTVKINLSKGKQYIYFVPNTQEIRGAIIQYKNMYSKFYKKDQVKFCIIPEKEFCFINETVIYDPNINTTKNNELSETKAVQWFPHKEFNYYLVIDKSHQSRLIGILDYLLKKYNVKDIEDII